MPKIVVARDTTVPDALRAYSVLVDGREVGALKAGESLSVDVQPGRHTLALKIDWCGSKSLEVMLGADETAHFSARSNLQGAKMFLAIYYLIFARDEYLTLTRTR